MTGMLSLDTIYSDNMVIPENKFFKVSGSADNNSMVYLKIDGKRYQSKSTDTGEWVIKIDPIAAKTGIKMIVKDLKNQIQIDNIQTGQVILLTGQSNIEYEFQNDCEYHTELKGLNFDNAFFYNVPKVEYENAEKIEPNNLPSPAWKRINSTNSRDISAIGYWIVKRLRQIYPERVIGIIDCYKGGTSASSWVPEDVLNNDKELFETFITPFYKSIEGKNDDDFKAEFVKYQQQVDDHNHKLTEFCNNNPDVSLSEAKDKVGHTPWPPPMTPTSFLRPNGLFHTIIEQVKNYPVTEVVWYQGENDADNPQVYKKLLKGLIISWRKLFEDYSLPFYIIQLPGYDDEPENAWPMIRQSQLETSQEINNIHLVSIADTGDKHNIHPESKRIAGTRIANIISGINYPQTPNVYKYGVINDDLILFVKNANTLNARGQIEFEIRYNQEWIKQEAYIQGNSVIIPESKKALAIRYAYQNYPICTIFNEYGDPLAPFEMGLKGEK